MQQVWSKISKVQADLAALEGEVEGLGSRTKAKLVTLPDTLTNEWLPILGSLDNTKNMILGNIEGVVSDVKSDEQALISAMTGNPNAGGAVQQSIQSHLASIDSRVKATTDVVRKQVEQVFGGAQDQVKASIKAQQKAAAALGTPIEAATAEMSRSIDGLRQTLEAQVKVIEDQCRREVDTLNGKVDQLEKQVKTALEVVDKGVDSAKGKIDQAAELYKTTCLSMFAPIDTTLTNLEASVNAPVKEMKDKLDAGEKQLQKLVDELNAKLDVIEQQGLTQINALLKMYKEIIAQASDVLAQIRGLIQALRATVMEPIDELYKQLDDLTKKFSAGVSTLTTLLQKVIVALDMIPSKGLPKAIVGPTIGTIQDGVQQALPQIKTAAHTAQNELTAVSNEIVGTVASVKQTAVTQINTVTETLNKQVNAVLPPVINKLQAVESQIESLVQTIVQQINMVKQEGLGLIKGIREPLEKAATALRTTIDGMIDPASRAVDKSIGAIRDKVDESRKLLNAMVDPLSKPLTLAINDANAMLNKGVEAIEKAVQAFDEQMAKQVDLILAPITTPMNAMTATMRKLESDLDTAMALLSTQNTRLVSAAMAQLPTAAPFTGQLDGMRQTIKGEINQLQNNLDYIRS